MATVYLKVATACPAIVVPGAPLDTDNANPATYPYVTQFSLPPALLTASRQGGAMSDQHAREGPPGGYGVLEGLTLLDAVSQGIRVREGVAAIDGPRVIKALAGGSQAWVPNPNTTLIAGIIPWTDNTDNVCWMLQNKTLTKVTGSLAAPSAACAFLGIVTMAAGVATAIDGSGVLTRRFGGPWERRTADAGIPGDTPPSNFCFLQHSVNADYWWNGTTYQLVNTAPASVFPSTLPAGQTWTLPAGYDAILLGGYVNNGSMVVNGRIKVLDWP